MTWIKRHTGFEWFDLLIHAGVTFAVGAFFAELNAADELVPIAVAASLLLLGVRRHFALKRQGVAVTTGEVAAARLEDVEQRLGELEAAQARVAELEERLEFAERLLTRDAAAVPPRIGGQHG